MSKIQTMKQWQMETNVMYVVSLLSQVTRTIGANDALLKNVLPQGWGLSSLEGYFKFVQKDFQAKETDFAEISKVLKLSKRSINILKVFPSEKEKGFVTVRMNVVVATTNSKVLIYEQALDAIKMSALSK